MILCDDAGPLDFLDTCVRDTWAAVLPATVVIVLLATSLSMPARLSRALGIVSAVLEQSLTLSEAETLEHPDSDRNSPASTAQDIRLIAGWRQITLASIAVLQFLWSTAGAGWLLAFKDVSLVWRGVCALIIAFSWLYAAASLVVIRRDARTSYPYSLFILFVVFLVGAALKLGGVVFDHVVYGFDYPSQGAMVMLVVNVVSILVGAGVLLATPIGHPSPLVDPKDIGVTVSSEDYVILWKWLTFSWMTPLMKLGKRVTLQQKDVWNLSPSMRARPVFVKFGTIIQSTLLRRLFVQNAQDLLFDALLTLATILFNYAGPFFLKRILDAIDGKNATKENRGKAYVFACLALVCTILKAQVELLHLWFGRRASARLRQALMAAIYDKALKRKDFSGVVKKDEEKAAATGGGGSKKSKAQAAVDKKKKESADDPKAGADIGKIVNLMSSDTNRLTFVIATLNNVYGAPFEIFIAVYFLYQLLGWSAFAGFSVTLIIWPVNTYLTRRRVRINKKHSNATDKRMGVLNELIAAIKLIKFYGWEERWIDKVNDARADELKMLVAARINSVFIGSIWTIAPVMVSVGSFYAYVMSGHDLTIGKAFTALALFNMVKDPVRGIPSTILQLTQASVALKRIEVYLMEDEVDGQVSSLKDLPTSSTSSEAVEGLGLEAATLTWNSVTEAVKSSHAKKQVALEAEGDSSSGHSQSDTSVGDKLFELQGISVMFPERRLSVVMGPTASGKTALLMALLGEMTLLEGRIIMSKDISRVDEYGLTPSISYAAQTPWLRHQSIRDNILFGSAYDEARYNDVLECCALNPDLNILEDGDATEIGARGINLSGGQKARVALARAVYARTKYVLLDDPLSAVDSHTARHLFDKLLTGPLLENRTVILVTHHVELVLPGTHYLVQMLDGRVHTQGSVEDLQTLGVLDGLVRRSDDETKKLQQDILEEVAVEGPIDTSKPAGATAGAASEDRPAMGSKKPKKLVKDEHREVGGVKWKVYNSYLRASSYWTWAIIFTFTAVLQFLTLGNKLWIRIWGDAYPSHASDSFSRYTFLDSLPPSQAPLNHTTLVLSSWPDASAHPLYYVGIYAAIGFLTAVAINVVGITNFTGALRASRLLFGQLLRSVVRATFRFHDTTPQGRILNRFGQDIQTIDTGLAGSLQSVNSSMAGFFTSVITIIVVFPPLLVPALLIGYVYRELATAYLRTGRDIRRMMANSRSPIYSDFGELLEGVVTVRAFSAEQRFLSNLYMRLDVFTKFWYFFWMTNRWLLINYDMLGGFSIFVTSLFSIYKLNDDAGLAGLCITSAMSFTASIYWASRNWTALELDLNAVERVIEYLAIPQEQPAVIESNRVPAYWPSRISSKPLVILDDLEVKYAEDLPAVLQNISLELNSGERVGLLGRTGSGKSTLAMSILRFVDPSKGRILIDGIDISTIGTHDLRSRLTFIPQDATLFSGTLRENLNPFGEYTDAECIDVLHRVGLIEPNVPSEPTSDSDTTDIVEAVVQGSSSKSVDTRSTHTQVERDSNKPIITLDTKIAAGGLNMSQGQRQLVAMARALLRNSSIIILDEATSSIDFATDSKIQKVIREGFTESLLLTIAHRLHTVIDYDRLIVLDKGKVVEFDTPWNLIHRDGGVFKDMCVKSGAFDELENLLRQNKQ